MREIKTLTGLRGYAALWVCVFHYALGWQDYDSWAMPLVRKGNYGVAVFFVLSGFILSYVYKQWFTDEVAAPAYRLFLWHRFARIYPLHALTLFLMLIVMVWGITSFGRDDNAVTFALNLLLLQAWGYPDSVTWNPPSWTISVEMFAYLLFPLTLRLMGPSPLWVVALICFAASSVDATYMSFLQRHGLIDLTVSQLAWGAYLQRYFCLFVLGMAAFQFVDRLGPRIKSSWMFDAAAIAGLLWLIWRGVYQGETAEIPYAAALLIAGLARDSGLGRLVFGNRAVVLLGEWSYALYLSHIIVGALMYDIAARLGYPFPTLPLALTVAIAILVAALLHYGFEVPCRRFLRGLALQPPRASGAP